MTMSILEDIMKKYGIAIFAALVLLFVGCPGDGSDGNDDGAGTGPKLIEAFPDTILNGETAKITLSDYAMTAVPGTSTSRLDANLLNDDGFDASAYIGFKFKYKTNFQANVGMHDTVEPDIMWQVSGGWGSFTVQDDWVEIECLFDQMSGRFWDDNAKDKSHTFDHTKIEKIWIGSDYANANMKFEIQNFTFILDPDYVPQNPPGVSPGDDTWYLATGDDGNLKSQNNTRIYDAEDNAYIYFTPNVNFNTITLTFTTNPVVNVKRQAVYDGLGTWGWGEGAVISGTALDLSGGSSWYGHGSNPLQKSTLKCIVLEMEGATTFTLTNVVITTTE